MTDLIRQVPQRIAVRPTRWQIGVARLILLAKHEGGWILGVPALCISLAFGVGAMGLLQEIARYGLWPVAELSWKPALEVLGILAAGAGALLAAAFDEGDALSRRELDDGVLLEFTGAGVTATVNGATTWYDWEHVRVHVCGVGVVVQLPRGTFHLIPRGAIAG